MKVPKAFRLKPAPPCSGVPLFKALFSSFQGGCAGSGCGKCDCHGVKGQKVSSPPRPAIPRVTVTAEVMTSEQPNNQQVMLKPYYHFRHFPSAVQMKQNQAQQYFRGILTAPPQSLYLLVAVNAKKAIWFLSFFDSRRDKCIGRKSVESIAFFGISA